MFTRLYGLETVSLRYFNVFGPKQSPESKYAAVVPLFMRAALQRRAARCPRRRRAVARLHLHRQRRAGEPAGAARRRASAARCSTSPATQRHSLLDIAAHRREASRPQAHDRNTRAPRPATCATPRRPSSKAERLLHYHPTVGFEDGMRRTFEHVPAQRDGCPAVAARAAPCARDSSLTAKCEHRLVRCTPD